ncbi:hypothetical protein B0T10DRAFT_282737 [Thelonectria olida]|uniref:Uncharacterized protein n=1 Tax=Thelonectria olida TaxID=1576542 RepID=A0A9P8W6M9_9HYPO|nr:hypothetical protein B0T10DRAFT_282737 [Thelonectria olida]
MPMETVRTALSVMIVLPFPSIFLQSSPSPALPPVPSKHFFSRVGLPGSSHRPAPPFCSFLLLPLSSLDCFPPKTPLHSIQSRSHLPIQTGRRRLPHSPFFPPFPNLLFLIQHPAHHPSSLPLLCVSPTISRYVHRTPILCQPCLGSGSIRNDSRSHPSLQPHPVNTDGTPAEPRRIIAHYPAPPTHCSTAATITHRPHHPLPRGISQSHHPYDTPNDSLTRHSSRGHDQPPKNRETVIDAVDLRLRAGLINTLTLP